ncbi:MAG: aspartate aminotransferase, partial [Rhodocyclaceae bacterium]|nr:aspartate aminotransferase [Rhodocyclaceae bacterium]
MDFSLAESAFKPAPDSTRWAKYAGRDVIPLWVADMDFPAPPAVVEA